MSKQIMLWIDKKKETDDEVLKLVMGEVSGDEEYFEFQAEHV